MKPELSPPLDQLEDNDIASLLVDTLPDAEVAAGSACHAAQLMRGERLTPREVIDTARSLGANSTTVLALLGYVHAPDSRQNRRSFYDLLTTRRSYPMPIGEAALALGLARMKIKELNVLSEL